MQFIETSSGRILSIDDIVSFGISQSNETALRAAGLCPIAEVYPDDSDMDYALYTMTPTDDLRFQNGRYERLWIRTPLPLPIARSGMKTRIATSRYDVEMGGMNWTDADGTTFRIGTDVDSRTRLQTALDACPEGSAVNFKLGGTFKALTRAELIALRDVVTGHVQACFDREAELAVAIDAAGDVEALAEIKWKDGWPGENGDSQVG